MDGPSAFFHALAGRCPNCGEGKLYTGFLTVAERCAHCDVRFERWVGSWTIPTVMGYGTGAVFAIVAGSVLFSMGRLEGNERPLVFGTLLFTLACYPVCKNISLFLLWNHGFMFPDPPVLVTAEPPGPAVDTGENTRNPAAGNESPSG